MNKKLYLIVDNDITLVNCKHNNDYVLLNFVYKYQSILDYDVIYIHIDEVEISIFEEGIYVFSDTIKQEDIFKLNLVGQKFYLNEALNLLIKDKWLSYQFIKSLVGQNFLPKTFNYSILSV